MYIPTFLCNPWSMIWNAVQSSILFDHMAELIVFRISSLLLCFDVTSCSLLNLWDILHESFISKWMCMTMTICGISFWSEMNTKTVFKHSMIVLLCFVFTHVCLYSECVHTLVVMHNTGKLLRVFLHSHVCYVDMLVSMFLDQWAYLYWAMHECSVLLREREWKIWWNYLPFGIFSLTFLVLLFLDSARVDWFCTAQHSKRKSYFVWPSATSNIRGWLHSSLSNPKKEGNMT